MGYETGIRSIHYLGYFGVALTVNIACDVAYRIGRADERIAKGNQELQRSCISVHQCPSVVDHHQPTNSLTEPRKLGPVD